MVKPVLFVDIDGVMADSISWWLTLYNFNHGTNHKRKDVTEYDTRVCINADLSPYFSNYDMVKPIPDALTSIDALSIKYRIVFATFGEGEKWLYRYFASPEVIKSKDKSLLRGFALIDDNPMNLDGFIGKRFLLSQPWNQGRGLNESNWNDITQYLMSI